MTFEAITNDITRFQTQLKVVVSDLRTAPLSTTGCDRNCDAEAFTWIRETGAETEVRQTAD